MGVKIFDLLYFFLNKPNPTGQICIEARVKMKIPHCHLATPLSWAYLLLPRKVQLKNYKGIHQGFYSQVAQKIVHKYTIFCAVLLFS